MGENIDISKITVRIIFLWNNFRGTGFLLQTQLFAQGLCNTKVINNILSFWILSVAAQKVRFTWTFVSGIKF
jgi:hypothetical protein